MALHKKTSSKRYLAQIITGADYADDIALIANTPTQAESLLHSLEQTAGSIGLRVNVDKTETSSHKKETCPHKMGVLRN